MTSSALTNRLSRFADSREASPRAMNVIHLRHIEILFGASASQAAAAVDQRVSFCTTGSTDAFRRLAMSVT